jgi:hypothetical protein
VSAVPENSRDIAAAKVPDFLFMDVAWRAEERRAIANQSTRLDLPI